MDSPYELDESISSDSRNLEEITDSVEPPSWPELVKTADSEDLPETSFISDDASLTDVAPPLDSDNGIERSASEEPEQLSDASRAAEAPKVEPEYPLESQSRADPVT
jgi:hypothetical protein